MAGTKQGGKRASETNRAKFGSEYYREIGKLGGQKKSPTKGFGSDKERARKAGQLGGLKSRKGTIRKPIPYDLQYEDIHSKTDTRKRVYGPVDNGVASHPIRDRLSRVLGKGVK